MFSILWTLKTASVLFRCFRAAAEQLDQGHPPVRPDAVLPGANALLQRIPPEGEENIFTHRTSDHRVSINLHSRGTFDQKLCFLLMFGLW